MSRQLRSSRSVDGTAGLQADNPRSIANLPSSSNSVHPASSSSSANMDEASESSDGQDASPTASSNAQPSQSVGRRGTKRPRDETDVDKRNHYNEAYKILTRTQHTHEVRLSMLNHNELLASLWAIGEPISIGKCRIRKENCHEILLKKFPFDAPPSPSVVPTRRVPDSNSVIVRSEAHLSAANVAASPNATPRSLTQTVLSGLFPEFSSQLVLYMRQILGICDEDRGDAHPSLDEVESFGSQLKQRLSAPTLLSTPLHHCVLLVCVAIHVQDQRPHEFNARSHLEGARYILITFNANGMLTNIVQWLHALRCRVEARLCSAFRLEAIRNTCIFRHRRESTTANDVTEPRENAIEHFKSAIEHGRRAKDLAKRFVGDLQFQAIRASILCLLGMALHAQDSAQLFLNDTRFINALPEAKQCLEEAVDKFVLLKNIPKLQWAASQLLRLCIDTKEETTITTSIFKTIERISSSNGCDAVKFYEVAYRYVRERLYQPHGYDMIARRFPQAETILKDAEKQLQLAEDHLAPNFQHEQPCRCPRALIIKYRQWVNRKMTFLTEIDASTVVPHLALQPENSSPGN